MRIMGEEKLGYIICYERTKDRKQIRREPL